MLLLCSMVKYYEGGLTFESAFELSYSFLYELSAKASEINILVKESRND